MPTSEAMRKASAIRTTSCAVSMSPSTARRPLPPARRDARGADIDPERAGAACGTFVARAAFRADPPFAAPPVAAPSDIEATGGFAFIVGVW